MTSQYWLNKKKELTQKKTIATKNKQELINYKKQLDDVKDHFSLLSPKFKKVSSYLENVVVNGKPIDEGYLEHTAEEIDKCISITENYIAFVKQKIEDLEADIRGLISSINYAEVQYKYALKEEQEAAESAAAAAAAQASSSGSGGDSASGVHSYEGATCFQKGTKVFTNNGLINIDDITEDTLVLTYNEDTKENEYKKVLKLIIHEDTLNELFTIKFDNYLLDVTASHRFYINGDWTEAKSLKENDEVMYFDGTLHKIENITSINKKDTYYNLEVEDNHNYYVSEKGVLVHNKKMIE